MSDSNAVGKARENKQNLPQFDRWSLILSCLWRMEAERSTSQVTVIFVILVLKKPRAGPGTEPS